MRPTEHLRSMGVKVDWGHTVPTHVNGTPIDDASLPPAIVDADCILDVANLQDGRGNSKERTGVELVYVVKPDGQPFVKIGRTWDVRARIKGMQTGNPYPIRLVVLFAEGTLGWSERALHRRFHAHREIGEWFRLEGTVLDWLRPVMDRRHG